MASRKAPRVGKPRQFGLNGSSAPRTEREWVVYRAGILEGIDRAHRDAHEKAEQFLLRAKCSGVDFDVPSAAVAVQTSAPFSPQLKRRRTA